MLWLRYVRSSKSRFGPAAAPAGFSIPGNVGTPACSDESTRMYAGSLDGSPRIGSAALTYSASAASRSASVRTEAASLCGMSTWSVGPSPTATLKTPTGAIPARFKAGTSASFAYAPRRVAIVPVCRR